MSIKRFKYGFLLLFIAAALLPPPAAAQNVNGQFEDLYGNNPDTAVPTPQDTLGGKRKRRPPKPLRSYYFPDSIKNTRSMFSWTFDPYTNNIELVPIDTALTNFQKDYFFLKENPVGVSYLGNLGAAVLPLNYADRADNEKLSFLDAYDEYLFREENVRFYNGRKPYTNASYFTSGQRSIAEEEFSLIHQQNITPSTAVNLSYRNNRTRGMYKNQQSINKNLSIALSHSGPKYSMHMGYIYNMGDIEENGGVLRDRDIRDTVIDLPQNVEMMLNDARNKFKGNVFYFTQSLAVPLISVMRYDSLLMNDLAVKDAVEGTTLFFGTSFKYSSYRNVYTDTKANSYERFYDKWYLNPAESRDSIRERDIDVKAFVQFQPYRRDGILGLVGGGVGYTNGKYYQFHPNDYLLTHKDAVEHDLYVYANAEGQYRKYFKWNADFRYFPVGSRSQDLYVKGKMDFSAYVRERPITLSLGAKFSLQSPSFWENDYYSNHFVWNNRFSKETVTELRGNLHVSHFRLNLGIVQNFLYNKIFYGTDGKPHQYNGTASVTGIYLNKDFVIGGLHLEHNLLFQYSSEQKVVPVPMFAANIAYYYEFNVVKNVLRLSLGVEGYYNTEWYGPGYNPAIQQFYNQRDVTTGNYPFMNAFIAGKWKRMRILVKYQHLNYELFGGRNYMAAAHYPHNRGMFKYGLSWSFYD